MEIGNLVIVIFVIGLVVTAPFLTGLMRKLLEKFSGINNDFETESHQIAPTFASDVSEVAKSSVLHGIGYVHGGVGSTRTSELRAQRKNQRNRRGIDMQSFGSIVQCIGAVVDIEFPRSAMPHIYDALTLDSSANHAGVEAGLTFEVQQQLGDGVVRTIAMGASDGLRRGMKINNSGIGISVPVGKTTSQYEPL